MLEQYQLLDEEAQKLKTECWRRNAAIDNIRQGIIAAQWYTEKNLDATHIVNRVKQRLQALRERPDWAESHENLNL